MPVRRKLVLSPAHGTRFKIYVQSPVLAAFSKPETVRISLPPAKVQPGPSDDDIVVRRPILKPPYPCGHPQAFVAGDGREWRGAVAVPVAPGPDGHFDHLPVDTPEFAAAAVYAIARRVSDIWSWYFGQKVEWFFRRARNVPLEDQCLELVPWLDTDTAHSGFGFVEYGTSDTQGQFNHLGPYWQNFDVIAHELGHQFLYATMGFPAGTKANAPYATIGTAEFRAFHESAGDLIALLSSLHFDSVRAHLLKSTAGDLGSFNEVSRIGELGRGFQFRSAFNYSKVKLAADDSIASLQFSDPSRTTDDGLPGSRKTMKAPAASATVEKSREFYYRASQVLTGAVFDILIETFQAILVAKGLIPAQLANDSDATWDSDPKEGTPERLALAQQLAKIHARFERAFRGHDAQFDRALCAARDYVGWLLAAHWSALSPNNLNFRKVARGLKAACAKVDRAGLPAGFDPAVTVARCFSWRGIAI
jgi:hypothetical protein